MGVHDGHRKRMLEEFLKNGIDNMNPHQILEMLLFYAIPRRDTNETGHLLMDSFGSLRAVFDAPFEELVKIQGIGEYAATLIKMIPQLARAYASDIEGEVIINDHLDASQFLYPRYIGRSRETVFVVCLDNKNMVTACVLASEGVVNSAAINIRDIIEIAMKHNAAGIVLAHNHPGGMAMPSGEDIEVTKNINALCKSLGIHLLDHVIFGNNDYVSMSDSGYFA